MKLKKIWSPLVALSLAATAQLVCAAGMLAATPDAASAFKRNEGEFANTQYVGHSLQLGVNRAFYPRQRPKHQIFGLYTSPPQESGTPFSSITANYQGKIPDNSELTFEVRTQGLSGQWSPWMEIKPSLLGSPVSLQEPASAWQYKLTFYATDPGHTPRVTDVSISTAEGAQK